MKKDSSLEQIHLEIERVRRQLLELGPIHPGSISAQHHACGNPSCRCHDPVKPVKHGPYNKLTYSHRGKSRCRFVRDEAIDDLQSRLHNYKTFRALADKWIELSIQAATIEFFTRIRQESAKAKNHPEQRM